MTKKIPRHPCFECGQPATKRHYVVPRARGGTKTVHLCTSCHAKARVDMSSLTREALKRAQRRGIKLGRTPLPLDDLALRVADMRRTMTLRQIANTLNAEGISTLRYAEHWNESSVNALLRRKALRPQN